MAANAVIDARGSMPLGSCPGAQPAKHTPTDETTYVLADEHVRFASMSVAPTLYVCHGDDGGPRIHPCRRVQEALREAGIEYEKVIAAHGSPIPFLRKGSRDNVREATGDTKLPALKLADGTVITHSKDILAWIKQQS